LIQNGFALKCTLNILYFDFYSIFLNLTSVRQWLVKSTITLTYNWTKALKMIHDMRILKLCQTKACNLWLTYNSMENIKWFSSQEWKILALQSWFHGPKPYALLLVLNVLVHFQIRNISEADFVDYEMDM
jgi:hypothetical protein